MAAQATLAQQDPEERARQLDGLLSNFVERLRMDGYALSYDALTEASGIFFDEIYRNPDDLSRLKYRLTPLFATCKADQEDLHRRIDELAVGAKPQTSLERRLERTAQRRGLWRALSLLPLVLIAGILFVVFSDRFESRPPIPEPPDRKQVEAPPIEVSSDQAPAIPVVDGTKVLPQTILVRYRDEPDPRNRFVIAAAILLPLYFAFLWWLFRVSNRRKWMRAASYEPDAPGVVSSMLSRARACPSTTPLPILPER